MGTPSILPELQGVQWPGRACSANPGQLWLCPENEAIGFAFQEKPFGHCCREPAERVLLCVVPEPGKWERKKWQVQGEGGLHKTEGLSLAACGVMTRLG